MFIYSESSFTRPCLSRAPFLRCCPVKHVAVPFLLTRRLLYQISSAFSVANHYMYWLIARIRLLLSHNYVVSLSISHYINMIPSCLYHNHVKHYCQSRTKIMYWYCESVLILYSCYHGHSSVCWSCFVSAMQLLAMGPEGVIVESVSLHEPAPELR